MTWSHAGEYALFVLSELLRGTSFLGGCYNLRWSAKGYWARIANKALPLQEYHATIFFFSIGSTILPAAHWYYGPVRPGPAVQELGRIVAFAGFTIAQCTVAAGQRTGRLAAMQLIYTLLPFARQAAAFAEFTKRFPEESASLVEGFQRRVALDVVAGS